MSDIDPSDIRRLRSLESRFAKATETTNELRAERRELKRQLTDAEKRAQRAETAREKALSVEETLAAEKVEQAARLRDAEQKAAAAEQRADELTRQINELIEENKRIAEEQTALAEEAKSLQEAAQRLRDASEAATGALRTAQAEQKRLAVQVEKLTGERQGLMERIELAEAQLTDEGKEPALPSSEVGRMFNELFEGFQAEMPAMELRGSTINLKVAIEGSGGRGGFIVPRPGFAEELKDVMQDVTLTFERKIEPTR